MKITGAQAIVQALLDEGVEVLFGFPGGAIMPAYDALHEAREQLRHVLVRHEQGAGHAAQGYARATGKVGVCIGTSGPGATNFVTSLVDALMDSTALVCVTGQVFSPLLGSDAFQEADVTGLTVAATKWNAQVVDAREIAAVMRRAFHVARSGRPGPVLVDVTKDAQFQSFDPAGEARAPAGWAAAQRAGIWRYPRDSTDLSRLGEAAALLNGAQRPFLLVGHGVSIAGAEQPLLALAERAGVPVASTLLGLSAFPSEHPLYVGMLGMHGNYGPNVLTNEADVIVAVGMRFDDRVTSRLDAYARQARIVHVEIDAAEIGKNVPVDVPLIADAGAALRGLLALVEPRAHPEWLARFRRCDAEEQARVIDAQLAPPDGPLKMAEVVRRISDRTAGQALMVSDVGQHQMHVARYYRYRRPRSHITSGGAGTMGFGLPAAVGAKIGATSREVIAVVGDGGFQMTLQELGTVMQEGTAVKIVVLNNNFLGMVRQWQELFFDKRYSGVEMQTPDFVTVASGYGIAGRRVAVREELDEALDAMLQAPGPYLLEVTVDREDNVFPMIAAGDSVAQIRLA